MGKETIAKIFQAKNKRDYIKAGLDMATKRKLQERNLNSYKSSRKRPVKDQ